MVAETCAQNSHVIFALGIDFSCNSHYIINENAQAIEQNGQKSYDP